MTVRIGHGFDVHRFTGGDRVILGGVEIPHTQALLAHSDGDVVLHAVCDALLGAMALGDIGRHFPDTDPAYKNISSVRLLQQVYHLVRQQQYVLGNLDVTVVAQAPRLAPYVAQMCERMAEVLEVSRGCINVKATTTEGLGFAGRQEGIAVHAVVLLVGSD